MNAQENLAFLIAYTIKRKSAFYLNDADPGRAETNSSPEKVEFTNKASASCQPVFLNRNLRRMKQIRKTVHNECVQRSNGMMARMVPLSQQLYFEVNTEDFMHYKRAGKSERAKEAAPKGKDSKSKRSLLTKRSSSVMQAAQECSFEDQ